jgi:membrane-bound lytic murein transglycosylase F
MKNKFPVTKICILSCFLFTGICISNVVAARSLTTIIDTNEIRICLAGSTQDFYKKNALAFVDYLNKNFISGELQATFISFEKWNDQFVKNNGKVAKDESYTPAPLASGECDLYPNDLVRVDWRESKMAYVDIFFSRNIILVHKSKINEYKQVSDLAGKTAAVMGGTSFHSWLEEQNETQFKSNPIKIALLPQQDAFKAISSNKYDFAITGADGAFWAINSTAPDAVVAFPVGKSKTIYGWCFRKEDKHLQAVVSDFFIEQRSRLDSQLNTNWKEYYGISLSEFSLFLSSTY